MIRIYNYSNYNQPQPPKTKVIGFEKWSVFDKNQVLYTHLGGIIFYQLFASIPQENAFLSKMVESAQNIGQQDFGQFDSENL